MTESGPAYQLYALIRPRLAEGFSAEAKAGMTAAMAPVVSEMQTHGTEGAKKFGTGFQQGLKTANTGGQASAQLVAAMAPVHTEMEKQGVTSSGKFAGGFTGGLKQATGGSATRSQLVTSMAPVQEEMSRQGAEAGGKFTSGMTESMKRLAVGFVGFESVKTLFDEVVKGADELAESLGKLRVAAENAGLSAEVVMEAEKGAAASGEKLGYTNAQVASAYAILITRTGSVAQSNKELTTAQDYAAVKGIDLASATNTINRAYLGNARALKDLGVIVPAHATETEKAAAVQDFANRIQGQAVEKADTLAGRAQVLKAQLADLGANIGTVLLPPLKSILGFFGDHIGEIAAFAGAMGSVMLASKLLGGSWLDLGAAGATIRRIFTDFSGSVEALTAKFGVLTGTQKAANEQRLADLVVIAIEKKETAALALQKLVDAQATGAASVTEGMLAEGRIKAAETALAATAATEAEAAASRGLMASLGPIAIAMAVVGTAVALFASSATSGEQPTQDLSQQVMSLGTASSAAAQGMLAGNQELQGLSTSLIAVGSSAKQFAEAFGGDVASAQQYVDSLTRASTTLGDTVVTAYKLISTGGKGAAATGWVPIKESIEKLSEAAQGNADVMGHQDAATQKLITTYQNYLKVIPQAQQALQAEQAAADLAAANAKVIGENSHVAAVAFHEFGANVDQATQDLQEFLEKNPQASIGDMFKSVTDAAVAVPDAIQKVTDHFKQTQAAVVSATQAVTDAQNSYAASGRAVEAAIRSEASAKQALVDANRAVVTAQHAIIAANQGVVDAEHNLTKAQQADTQSQLDLIQARKDAAQQLQDLHRQVMDQAASEESARIALYEAQQNAMASGIDISQGPVSLPTGPVTGDNIGQQKAQLALVQAQDALNDTMATGAKLRDQVADADARGVDKSVLVLNAQQKLTDAALAVAKAQQALQTATDGVSSAEYNLTKAQQGVVNARQAITDAIQAVTDAQDRQEASARALASAISTKDDAVAANSHTLDLNTVAGRANAVQMQDTATAILNSHQPDADKLKELQDLGSQYGNINDLTNEWIINVEKQNGKKIVFDVNGMASISVDALMSALYPGSSADFQARMGEKFAEGGPVSGRGGPTEDNIPLWGSVGEYMHKASAVDYYGVGLMDAINRRAIPREKLIMNTAIERGWDGAALLGHLAGAQGYAQGGPIGPVQSWLTSLAGKPYVWGGVGPSGYDCSGLVGEVWARLTGHPSYRRYMTTANERSFFQPGHGVFTVGLSDEHTAGNLGGLAFEAANPHDGIKIGASAQSVNNFPVQLYLPIEGAAFTTGGNGIGGSFAGASQLSAAQKRFVIAANARIAEKAAGYESWGTVMTGLTGKPLPPLPATAPPGLGNVGASGGSANQQLMQSIFASMFGWTGPEWQATVALINRESGFRNTAQNPTSTAYGQFQFLDSTWASYGIPKTSDPRLQDIAGGRYIKSRYGDPLGAVAHENSYGWYDSGGWLKPGLLNGTGRPEAVLTPEESAGLRAAVQRADVRLDAYTIAQLAQAFIMAASQHPLTVTLNQAGVLGVAGL